MPQKNFLSLARNKIENGLSQLRLHYYRLLGVTIGLNSKVGKVTLNWPNKILIGAGCDIQENSIFRIHHPFDDENYIEIGDRVFVGNNCEFNCNTKISIGNDCLIASNTIFVDTGHNVNLGTNINQQTVTSAPIVIEADVWIGARCTILKGVRIGRGSVIGAGSVVNKIIPSNQIWAGVPARFIRKRT